ncbi:MAG: hypothetical protein AAF152_15035 [Cyanobacteria bacterium P01_A01_bin.114]
MAQWIKWGMVSVVTGSVFLGDAVLGRAAADTSTAAAETALEATAETASTAVQLSENTIAPETADALPNTTELSAARHLPTEEQWLRAEQANRLYDRAERYRRLGEQTKALESYRSALFIFEVLAASSAEGEAQESFQVAADFVRSRLSELGNVTSQAE